MALFTSYIVKNFDTFNLMITMGIGPMWGIISGPFISSLVFETWNNVNPSSKIQLLSLNETLCTVTIQKKVAVLSDGTIYFRWYYLFL